MKTRLLVLFLAAAYLLCGCNAKGGNDDYTQKVLPAPDRMEVKTGSTAVEYLPESTQYQKLYAAIRPNWWKTTGDNKAETAPENKLFMAESPEQLRCKSDCTFSESSDTLLYFHYEKEPFPRVNPTGPDPSLTAIVFLLPQGVASEENVKGCYRTMEKADAGYCDGPFTYYFPPEIAASFWDFIRE